MSILERARKIIGDKELVDRAIEEMAVACSMEIASLKI